MTAVAPETINCIRAWDGGEVRPGTFRDPATGTLFFTPERSREIDEALRRAAYECALDLYRRQPGLKLALFKLKLHIAALKAKRFSLCFVQKALGY